MKSAVVFSVPSKNANGYSWRWRSTDGDEESPVVFAMYHDCLADARKHGFKVELQRAKGASAPSGGSPSPR